jgi:UDP-N-acetylmuramoylalanine--D-glutamate ligase
MQGKRIAIFGLGRSGLAIAKAALANDAYPHVYDQKILDNLPKPEAYHEAVADGINVTLGWEGTFDASITDLIVANPAIDRRHPALRRAMDDGIEIISEVEFAFRISKAPIVAITGTNGKSTTTVMTYLCLKACGEQPVLCGNIFGSGYDEVPLTEAALNATPDQTLVAEVSSFQLEWVSKFKPVSAGITNIWPDHLDRYTGFEEYAATKQRIFDRMDSDDTVVVKANDPVVVAPGGKSSVYRPRRARAGAISSTTQSLPTVLTFGATGEHGKVDEMDLKILNQTVRLSDLPFDEPHNYTNACMAALLTYGALMNRALHDPSSHAAKLLEAAENKERARIKSGRTVYDGKLPDGPILALPDEVIVGLKAFQGLAHRMERLGEKNGIRVINNSMCTNPDAVIKSAQSVKDPAHLLIGGVNKGLDFKPLKHYLANHRHHAYLFGTGAQQLDEMLGGNYPIFVTMKEAFEAATRAAVSGEVIMLAPGCASNDQFRDFRDRGNVFKAIAKEWLCK